MCQELLADMKSVASQSVAPPDIYKGEYVCKCSIGGYFEEGLTESLSWSKQVGIKTLLLLLLFFPLLVLF